VMTNAEAPAEKRVALEAMGVQVIVVGSAKNHLHPTDVLAVLAERGVTRLMVEGGRTVWQAFAQLGCIDEAIIFVQGHRDYQPANFQGLSTLPSQVPMTLVQQTIAGADRGFNFVRTGT